MISWERKLALQMSLSVNDFLLENFLFFPILPIIFFLLIYQAHVWTEWHHLVGPQVETLKYTRYCQYVPSLRTPCTTYHEADTRYAETRGREDVWFLTQTYALSEAISYSRHSRSLHSWALAAITSDVQNSLDSSEIAFDRSRCSPGDPIRITRYAFSETDHFQENLSWSL